VRGATGKKPATGNAAEAIPPPKEPRPQEIPMIRVRMFVAVFICILVFPAWFLQVLTGGCENALWFGSWSPDRITIRQHLGYYFGGMRRKILAAIRRDPFYKEPW
jgi:hypothetical protein